MILRFKLGWKGRTAFLIVGSAAVFAAIAQISLGGLVRVTESGLGCPDWPLCHGRLIPPMEFHTLIEYSHRLSASVLGMVVLISTIIAYRSFRRNFLIVGPTTASLILVLIGSGLGGAAVLTELDWRVVLIHLSIAEGLVASMIIAVLAAWKTRNSPYDKFLNRNSRLIFWLSLSTVGAFILILSGSYMVGLGYGASCMTWPSCHGSFFPSLEPQLVHMAHRGLALILGLVLTITILTLFLPQFRNSYFRCPATAVIVAFMLQMLLGATTVWTDFSTHMRALHLIGATLLWATVVLLAGMYFIPSRMKYPDKPVTIKS